MPIYPTAEQILIYAGTYFRAEWYYTDAGERPAFRYYDRLSDLDQNRFDHLIVLFCDTQPGTILPKKLYRVEDKINKVYAFKPGPQRFFNFTTDGAKVIVTNAYRKHSDEMTKQDLELLKVAARCRADYLRRNQEGTYYER